MLVRPRKNKRFEYTPQFYDPKKEENLKKRMKFRSIRKKTSRKSGNLIRLLILLAFVVYLYLYLSGKI